MYKVLLSFYVRHMSLIIRVASQLTEAPSLFLCFLQASMFCVTIMEEAFADNIGEWHLHRR